MTRESTLPKILGKYIINSIVSGVLKSNDSYSFSCLVSFFFSKHCLLEHLN